MKSLEDGRLIKARCSHNLLICILIECVRNKSIDWLNENIKTQWIRYQNKRSVQWMMHQKLIKSRADKKHDWNKRKWKKKKKKQKKQMVCTVHGTTDPPSYLITRYISVCVQCSTLTFFSVFKTFQIDCIPNVKKI